MHARDARKDSSFREHDDSGRAIGPRYHIGRAELRRPAAAMFRALKYLFLLDLACDLRRAGWLWWFANEPLELAARRSSSRSRRAVRCVPHRGRSLAPASTCHRSRSKRWREPRRSRATSRRGPTRSPPGTTPLELLGKLTRGDFALVEVKFIEGWTFRQLREALDAPSDVRHDTKGLPDARVMQRLGPNEAHPEGLFFPDTYLFAGAQRCRVLRARHRAMAKRARRGLGATRARPAARKPVRGAHTRLDRGEGNRPAVDRPLIAAVFVNRLRKGMRLQADPTVIYGLGEQFDGNLRRRDLVADTPYNTYTREGLPPTPIALPAQASLDAALNPPPTDALYFVARGDGTDKFSRTLEEHNRAVTSISGFRRA